MAQFSSFTILRLFGAMVAVIWKGAHLLATGEMATGDYFVRYLFHVYWWNH
ncbi:MAG: hypothetical protein U0Z17_05195 [Bacteroidales bacterium]